MKATSIFLIVILFSSFSCTHKKPIVLERDNATISYDIAGKGKITLLFVHGAFINQTYWGKQVEYFMPHYKIVTIDLPGHGNSGKDRQDWSLEGFAEDINYVIDRLKLKNVILIGHSMSGDINLMAATNKPKNIIGFIGIDNFKDAGLPIPEEYQPQIDTMFMELKVDFPTNIEKFVRKSLVSQNTSLEVTDKVVKDFREAHQPMALKILPEVFQMSQKEKELLAKLKLKLYLINVDYSPTNEKALKRSAINGFEVIHVNGTSHYPMIENPLLFNHSLEEAINKISKNLN